MKQILDLSKLPRYFLPVTVLILADAIGLIVSHQFSLDTPLHVAEFVLCSLLFYHYGHLLDEHIRIRTSGAESSLKLLLDYAEQKTKGVSLAQASGWLELLEVFRTRDMSSDFIDDLLGALKRLTFPRQVEFIFRDSLENEIKAMSELAQESLVTNANRDKQYLYAGSVATFYVMRGHVPTIYATALDTPSLFIGNQLRYFTKQQNFRTATALFEQYLTGERENLLQIISNTKGDPTAQPAWRSYPAPPEKARIVVIERQILRDELANPLFWDFVKWHVKWKFGLKFFVRDSRRPNWYEEQIALHTDRRPEETIKDFIAYGNQCVFGRVAVNAAPNPEGHVTLGFNYARELHRENESIVARYSEFFVRLWQDSEGPKHTEDKTFTLTDLWVFPEFQQTMRGRLADLEELAQWH